MCILGVRVCHLNSSACQEHQSCREYLLPQPHMMNPFSHTHVDIFNTYTVNLLQPFCHARLLSSPTILRSTKWKWTKKGKVSEVASGIRNLLSIVMEVRDKPLLISLEDGGIDTTLVNAQNLDVEENPSSSITLCTCLIIYCILLFYYQSTFLIKITFANFSSHSARSNYVNTHRLSCTCHR